MTNKEKMLNAWDKYVECTWSETEKSMTCECVKGLWSVTGPNVAQVLAEAEHYFNQYYEDGEYD